MLISRHLNALAALTVIGLTGVTGAAIAAGPSSQFDLNGDVGTPGVYDSSSLSALPATSETVDVQGGRSPGHGHLYRDGALDAARLGRRDQAGPGGQEQQPAQLCRRCRKRRLRGGFFRRRAQSDVRRQFFGAGPGRLFRYRVASSASPARTDLRGWSSPAIRRADAMCPISSTSLSARRRSRPKARAACRPSSR